MRISFAGAPTESPLSLHPNNDLKTKSYRLPFPLANSRAFNGTWFRKQIIIDHDRYCTDTSLNSHFSFRLHIARSIFGDSVPIQLGPKRGTPTIHALSVEDQICVSKWSAPRSRFLENVARLLRFGVPRKISRRRRLVRLLSLTTDLVLLLGPIRISTVRFCNCCSSTNNTSSTSKLGSHPQLLLRMLLQRHLCHFWKVSIS